jgi:phospholipid-transporting ATPase
MIDEITMSDGQPLIFVPLTSILFVTAFKDIMEDLGRRKSDREEN